MAETAVMDAPSAAPISTPPTPPVTSSSPATPVTPAAVDKGPQSPPPRPGSAKDRMFQDLRKKAGEEPAAETTKPSPETTTTTPETTTAAPETTTPEATAAGDKKKASPWKLVDEHKAARLKAETELAELRKSVIPPEKVKEITDRAAKLEADYKAAQEELRFTNYAKSQEFAEKYQKPYEESWKRWMGELGELTINDPATGNERPLQPQDLLELVNMPLQKAREHAEATFGSFANDVMSARKEIRGLFDAQHKALEEARKGGEQRLAQAQQQMAEQHQAISRQIGELWTKSNEMAQADERFGKFFKPVEGDEDGNARLKKGYEIADKAFSVNPLDPKLSPEQRQQIVQLHAAVRNRSAAFGRLTHQNEKLAQTVAELQAELGKFKAAQPGEGEARRDTTTAGTTVHESVFGALRKLAH